jgi:hypothetical protein
MQMSGAAYGCLWHLLWKTGVITVKIIIIDGLKMPLTSHWKFPSNLCTDVSDHSDKIFLVQSWAEAYSVSCPVNRSFPLLRIFVLGDARVTSTSLSSGKGGAGGVKN